MSELSVSLGVTMGNTTGLVDRLIKEGYVAREHDPGDRRIVIVKLTGKGKKITEKIIERKSSMLLKIFSSSSQKEINTILSVIERVINTKGDQ